MHGICVACRSRLIREVTQGDGIACNCPLCGEYKLSGTAESIISNITTDDDEKATILSYAIRKMQSGGRRPYLDSNIVEQIIPTIKLPAPMEQANELVLWLGRNVKEPGKKYELASYHHRTLIGARSAEGFKFVIEHLHESGLLNISIFGGMTGAVAAEVVLTFKGWEKYYELEHGASDSRKAFMAMKYGNADLEDMFVKVFKPAITQTGFHLERLIDRPKAGLIDNRLRVEILSSRFLIADLTDGNAGAYWEAGFAEGLGKPVIYMCEEGIFKDPSKGTHFDTNHHHTVLWRKDNPKETADDLKATVRATLPAEAKLED